MRNDSGCRFRCGAAREPLSTGLVRALGGQWLPWARGTIWRNGGPLWDFWSTLSRKAENRQNAASHFWSALEGLLVRSGGVLVHCGFRRSMAPSYGDPHLAQSPSSFVLVLVMDCTGNPRLRRLPHPIGTLFVAVSCNYRGEGGKCSGGCENGGRGVHRGVATAMGRAFTFPPFASITAGGAKSARKAGTRNRMREAPQVCEALRAKFCFVA
jgi:hypothetical protein